MRSLKLEAFGAGRISASWDETGGNAAFCNGGQIVMERRRFTELRKIQAQKGSTGPFDGE